MPFSHCGAQFLTFQVPHFVPITSPTTRKYVHPTLMSSEARPRRSRPRPSRRTPPPASRLTQRPTSLTSSERLQKVLAHMGVASRRAAEDMILSERVSVNGRKVSTLGTQINPYTDSVIVDGRKLELPRLTWMAVHKPRGVLSVAVSDKYSVANYVSPSRRRGLVAVAPIEEDSSGLVILSNDRIWTNSLSKLGNGFVKEWVVDCEGVAPWGVVDRLKDGVELAEGNGERVCPTDVHLIGRGPLEIGNRKTAVITRFEVRLRDNRRHVIRRMFEAVGERVVRASRKSFGPVLLGSLKRGDSRYLSPKEIMALKRGVSSKTGRPSRQV